MIHNNKIADALVESGYIVLENALESELLSALLVCAKDENSYKNAGISSSAKLHLDASKRRDKTRWIDADTQAQSAYLALTKSLQEYLNSSLYLGLSYYESHFAIYEKGDFYEKHLDAFKGSKNRVVTTVLYLNEEWSPEDGGELLIYNESEKLIKKITPNAGTLVVFMSEKFPHEVLRANKKRYSIAGWFRIDR